MKHLHITFLLIMLMSIISNKVQAYDFIAGGIAYYFINNKTELSVCSRGGSKDDKYKGDIVIPAKVTYSGNTYPVTAIRQDAFYANRELKSVVIPNSVTQIGSGAFNYCSGLSCIEIPNSVTDIKQAAFSNCNSLKSVIIADGESNLYIESSSTSKYMFSGTPITSLYLGRNTYGSLFYSNNALKELTIGKKVTSIGSSLFSGCTGLSSIIIPNSVTNIGDHAFSGCTGLTSVSVSNPVSSISVSNSVTSIGEYAFYGCTGLITIEIPNSVSSIAGFAFSGCTSLTSITIPNSVTGIGSSAFSGCTALSNISIPNSVTSIGYGAFSGCTGLKNVKIEDGDGLLEIYGKEYEKLPFNGSSIGSLYIGRNISYGNYLFPFQEISTLKEVTIGSKVTSLGSIPFWYCTDITSIVVDPSNTKYDSRDNCNAIIETATNTLIAGCENTIIPQSVIKIGDNAFSGRKGLTSFVIPNHVMEIGTCAFYSCLNLNSVRIEDGDNILKLSDSKAFNNNDGYGTFTNSPITSLYLGRNYTCQYSPFRDLTTLKDVTIGNKVTSIGEYAFSNCKGLTSVEMLPNGVTSIGKYAFYGCTGLKNISIPNSVTCIDDYAFRDCTGLISLSDNITSIGKYVFSDNSKLLVNKGTKTLLYIWNENKNNKRGYVPYDKETNEVLTTPELSAEDITQTTATIKVSNIDMKDGYTYSINNEVITNTVVKFSKLKPESTQQFNLVVTKDDVHYDVTSNFTTKGMNLNIEYGKNMTASSIHALGSYLEEDAKVVAQRMYILNKPTEGNECFASGLNPGRSYTIVNEVDVEYGGEAIATCRTAKSMSPTPLKFNVAQPKVVSQGNAIVSASANLDPEEENVGFEWRRTDWTEEFPSNTGQAYLYEGVIEGYIKNLNADKLWKFRPYYLSDDGTYHYGDWMGLDPTNTSYFEPTVHTYAKINIEGNTALVRGYALAGTDKIKVQGFKYWKTSNNAPHRAPVIPSDAKTIEAIGQQIITATLAALDYNSTYHYVAFVTTEDGTTYYGEEQVFNTPMPPAGIDDVTVEAPSSVKKKGVYTLTGVKLADDKSELQGLPQGMYVIDGKKVMIK